MDPREDHKDPDRQQKALERALNVLLVESKLPEDWPGSVAIPTHKGSVNGGYAENSSISLDAEVIISFEGVLINGIMRHLKPKSGLIYTNRVLNGNDRAYRTLSVDSTIWLIRWKGRTSQALHFRQA